MAKPAVFIAMAFAPIYRAGFDQVVCPGIEKAGAEAIRADAERQGHIHTQMFERIIDSKALVVDLSGLNPNVFYEMGVAHATHRRTVMVVNRKYLEKVPFDIAPYRVLIYPEPSEATPEEIQTAIDKLAVEVREILDHPNIGIPNPVMDFLTSRSPATAEQTLYLPFQDDAFEREIILSVRHHLTAFGVAGSNYSSKVLELIESGQRSPDMEFRLRLLDPEFIEGWKFKCNLQHENPVSEDDFQDYLAEKILAQRRNIKKLKLLATRFPSFRLDVRYYRSLPLFWACGWDDKKWSIGHYVPRRLVTKGLPVTIISASDPRTTSLYAHYADLIRDVCVNPA
jgi:hypothetical protein